MYDTASGINIDMSCRCSRAEEQLAAAVDEYSSSLSALESSSVSDLELGGLGGGGGGRSLQRRNAAQSKGKMLGEFEKMGVHTGPNVAKAVDMIDTWTLVTGRLVQQWYIPYGGFLCMLLHHFCWCVVVRQLVFSTNTLAVDDDRFLRHYPLLRMSFVLYLLLIHLWALVILAVQTHSLDLEE